MNGGKESTNAMKELTLLLIRALYLMIIFVVLIGLTACDENEDIAPEPAKTLTTRPGLTRPPPPPPPIPC